MSNRQQFADYVARHPMLPMWHKRPTGPGRWVSVPDDDGLAAGMQPTVLDIDEQGLAQGAPFRSGAVYGPLPLVNISGFEIIGEIPTCGVGEYLDAYDPDVLLIDGQPPLTAAGTTNILVHVKDLVKLLGDLVSVYAEPQPFQLRRVTNTVDGVGFSTARHIAQNFLGDKDRDVAIRFIEVQELSVGIDRTTQGA